MSRTIGDIEAKDTRYGGKADVVISTPEIRSFKIVDSYDFMLMGCDGVFEKMTNQEIMKTILQSVGQTGFESVHERGGKAIDAVLN